MPLTGQQIGQIQEALLRAFPSKDDLGMMVRIQLDARLDAIAGGENLRVLVFKLLTWAESNGRISDLIEGAYHQNPGNPDLGWLVQEARTWPTLVEAQTGLAKETSSVAKPVTAPPNFLSFEWVTIPAGEFTMSKDAGEEIINLPEYYIAKRPVTNAQYKVFVDAKWRLKPHNWKAGQIPSGKEDRSVRFIQRSDALAFCAWASKRINRMQVRLPSEAEWEKAMFTVDTVRALWEWTSSEDKWGYVMKSRKGDAAARQRRRSSSWNEHDGFRCVVIPIPDVQSDALLSLAAPSGRRR
jgi:hypothetical protein